MLKIVERVRRHFNRKGLFYKTCRALYVAPHNIFSDHGYIKQYVCFHIAAFCRIHHIRPFYDKNAQELEKLKDIHIGKRCFVIATGPSLRLADVEKLSNEVTIGVNSIYRLYDKTTFRPMYYTVLDEAAQKKTEENIEKYNRLSTSGTFMNDLRRIKIAGINYIPYCYQNHWFKLGDNKFDYSENLKYCTDLLWGLYDKYTITNAAIELAIYMGCKEIFLIGVDCNYTGPQVHFDTTDDEEITQDIAYHTQKAMVMGFRFIERETKKRGIHIYNATRGGMLEEFDRVDFDSLFEANR